MQKTITDGETGNANSTGFPRLFLSFPLFALLPSSEDPAHQWLVQGPDSENITYISEMIQSILDGTSTSHYPSERINESDKYQITYDNLEKVIEENHDNSDTVIAFASTFMGRGDWFSALLPEVDKLINNTNIKFYVYNLTTNYRPANISIGEQPLVMMYPKNTKTTEVYRGNPNIKHFIDWIKIDCDQSIRYRFGYFRFETGGI